jgi:hypothetical protein
VPIERPRDGTQRERRQGQSPASVGDRRRQVERGGEDVLPEQPDAGAPRVVRPVPARLDRGEDPDGRHPDEDDVVGVSLVGKRPREDLAAVAVGHRRPRPHLLLDEPATGRALGPVARVESPDGSDVV